MLVDRFAARVMRSRRSMTSAAGKMRVAWVVLFLGMLKAKSHNDRRHPRVSAPKQTTKLWPEVLQLSVSN